MTTETIHRRSNGTIDIDFYRARAAQRRQILFKVLCAQVRAHFAQGRGRDVAVADAAEPPDARSGRGDAHRRRRRSQPATVTRLTEIFRTRRKAIGIPTTPRGE